MNHVILAAACLIPMTFQSINPPMWCYPTNPPFRRHDRVPTPITPPNHAAGNSADIITQRYTFALKLPSPTYSSLGDIQMNCIEQTFRIWAGAYLNVLDRTSGLDPTATSGALDTFAFNWFLSVQNLELYDHYRVGLNASVAETMAFEHTLSSTPASLNIAAMSLTEIEDQLYQANLKICLDPRFLTDVGQRFPPYDPNAILLPSAMPRSVDHVRWNASHDSVGIEPEAIYRSQDADRIAPAVPMTYGDFLRSLQQR